MSIRKCPVCDKILHTGNKTGFCTSHRDRSGKNNPFYGKKHSKDTIESTKVKLSELSKEKWKDPVYREKVILGVSKPRRVDFKKEQSERIKKWYEDNPAQREIRKTAIMKTWSSGRMVAPSRHSYNRSKKELNLFHQLVEVFSNDLVSNNLTVRYENKHYFPDICINGFLIIEFFGNYFHMNPEFYTADCFNTILKLKASDIWERDNNRINLLESIGYSVMVVWEKDWKDKRESVLDSIRKELCVLNWEYCV